MHLQNFDVCLSSRAIQLSKGLFDGSIQTLCGNFNMQGLLIHNKLSGGLTMNEILLQDG